ncbi:hypothetical protein [Phyllobacterium endophyticum]|jgi:hypothetical protein|uniref:Uncharacterized protein n=1 Tax=Phyllobacterium endophyticum TaxID=1149773 RepID=A0A2P7AWU2_9HYPH|nr:hypothetical protein [Phyllobacterium endophyticum]MBB3238217.1 hypothetical protein [Phyllobacterium endophyticum]PSH58677.1 hypothetical protein CU100_14015 [Phyllobacterium endophyticum]TXR46890.1 hypothetical protein FVA77_22605 [Phyllobacterium endophyticum]TYR39366.1 hypothetical protein FY050_25845 [Phyllobacterium endophyticum]
MTQWLDILREKNDLAGQLSEKIPRFLAYEALTLDQARRLHAFLEQHALEMRALAEDIGAVDLAEVLHEAAAALDRIFADLAHSAALKVAELEQRETRSGFKPKLVYN